MLKWIRVLRIVCVVQLTDASTKYIQIQFSLLTATIGPNGSLDGHLE